MSVLVAEPNPDLRADIVSILHEAGHKVVAEVSSGSELIREAVKRDLDILVLNVKLPGQNGFAAIKQINEQRPVPHVIVTQSDFLGASLGENVSSWLAHPVKPFELISAICVAYTHFKEVQELKKQNEDLRRNLAERKVIEQAKGVLMRREKMGESQAYRHLQKRSMDLRMRMAAFAKRVIDGVDV